MKYKWMILYWLAVGIMLILCTLYVLYFWDLLIWFLLKLIALALLQSQSKGNGCFDPAFFHFVSADQP